MPMPEKPSPRNKMIPVRISYQHVESATKHRSMIWQGTRPTIVPVVTTFVPSDSVLPHDASSHIEVGNRQRPAVAKLAPGATSILVQMIPDKHYLHLRREKDDMAKLKAIELRI
ncbi:hypothetical protein DPSP01_001102 [Paraphaeosphaeria sporulosa]